jgi:hypothetical protein
VDADERYGLDVLGSLGGEVERIDEALLRVAGLRVTSDSSTVGPISDSLTLVPGSLLN